MNKKLRIALFGAHVNSTNLGCQALTYSLLSLLDTIAKELDINFTYILFEYNPDSSSIHHMCELIGIDENNIINRPMEPIFRARSYVKHLGQNISMLKLIKSCDLAIDITAGDSFSDIYGQERFSSLTVTKYFVELLGVPLILGPQTYGPFYKKRNEKFAARVMQGAYKIIARDSRSAKLATDLSKRPVSTTNDLAFMLPYSYKYLDSDRYKLGINVSGLLVKEKYESEAGSRVVLKTDYDSYIDGIISWAIQTGLYDIYLTSHVKEDVEACRKIKNKHNECHVVEFFDNPIDGKNFISGLDIFLGSRMHAIIASFTTGVATIPAAYSRKFTGLFESMGYNRVIDLQTEDTQDSINKAIEYISAYKDLKNEVVLCYENANKNNEITHSFFKDCISEISQRSE